MVLDSRKSNKRYLYLGMLQALCPPLQAGVTIRRDLGSLHVFMHAGGFGRLTHLLQWAALTFGAPDSGDGSGGDAGGNSDDPQPSDPAAEARSLSEAVTEAVAVAAAASEANGQVGHQRGDSVGSGARRTVAEAGPSLSAPPRLPAPPAEPALVRRASSEKTPALPSMNCGGGGGGGRGRNGLGGIGGGDAPQGSPLAHPLPGSLQGLDSTRVRLLTLMTSCCRPVP